MISPASKSEGCPAVVTQFCSGKNEQLPAQKRAASTRPIADDEDGLVEDSPPRVFRGGEGTFLFKHSHHPPGKFVVPRSGRAYDVPEPEFKKECTQMQKQSIALKIVVVSLVTVVFPLLAQEPKPTCNHCSATYIPKSELDAYTKRAIENKLVDQQVRSVDIGKAKIGIGLVTRNKLSPNSSSGEAVAEHEQISEVYYIIEGSATLLTGPDLVDTK